MGVMRPELVMKSIVPVVMAGVLGIYGLIIAVIISTGSMCYAKSFEVEELSVLALRSQPIFLSRWTYHIASCCSQPEYGNTILLV